MLKMAKLLAGTAIATSLLIGAATAGSPIVGDYYEGIDSTAGRGELRKHSAIDLFTTGSVGSRTAGDHKPQIKGGEGEYYPGIQRN